MDLVNATYFRNNLSKLIDAVVKEGKKFVLIRDSEPTAALVPYSELVEKEKEWRAEFRKLTQQARQDFKSYLKSNKMSPRKINEEKLYELANRVSGRT